MSTPIEKFADIFNSTLIIISFVIYIFIIIVYVLSREKLTIYKYFKIQTLPFSIIYTIANLNFYSSSKEPTFFCKFITNIRSITFIVIISIQTLILLFIFTSLKSLSYIEKYLNKIYIWLYLIPHLSWIIMVLLSFTGGYTKNQTTGLCKYDNLLVTYYRTILYVLNAIVCVVLFIFTIKVIKTSQVNTKVISIYVKSFILYFSVLFVYLLSYLTITVLMVLEMEIGLKAGFDNSKEICVWFFRVISQNLAPIIVSCLNCLSKAKVIYFLKKICGNKCETLLLKESSDIKEIVDGANISMKIIDDNDNDNEIEIEPIRL